MQQATQGEIIHLVINNVEQLENPRFSIKHNENEESNFWGTWVTRAEVATQIEDSCFCLIDTTDFGAGTYSVFLYWLGSMHPALGPFEFQVNGS